MNIPSMIYFTNICASHWLCNLSHPSSRHLLALLITVLTFVLLIHTSSQFTTTHQKKKKKLLVFWQLGTCPILLFSS